MRSRILFITVILFILSVAALRTVTAADSFPIKINGRSAAVDIDDIIDIGKNQLTGEEIKRICSEITKRYHEKGYTAFYIDKVVLDKDGRAELYFNESLVTEVDVEGITERRSDVAASVFITGEPFNEYTLKDNVTQTKMRFNLRHLNVTVRRGGDGNIILIVNALERMNELEMSVYGSPVYGTMPELKYRINYGGFLAGVSAASTFAQRERSITGGSVFFNSDNAPGHSYFTLSADLSDRKDSSAGNDELVYRHRSVKPRGGYCYLDGVYALSIFLAGTADKLSDYSRSDGGVSFTGAEIKLNYNDSAYKIDHDDVSSCGIDLYSGWNFIEGRFSSKIELDYAINFPVITRFFLSFNGKFFYTSDEMEFLHVYIYDGSFPCRNDDFSTASWRNITGIDLVYEIIERTFYIAPELKWGCHNSEGESNIYAAGIKFIIHTGKIKADVSYLYDVSNDIKNGSFMFSAGAVY